MKASKEMIMKACEIVEEMELDSKYGYIGIRVQDVPFELGEMQHHSKVWEDGFETDEELDGVCALSVESLKQFPSMHDQYSGDYYAIVCGNCVSYGEDLGEIVIKDAVCEYIL